MKMKYTLLAVIACSIAILPAQTEAPAKPAAEKAEEVKAETPVEKQAFKIFDLMATLPSILGEIKDEPGIAVAQEKLDALTKKIELEEAALLKLEVPDNAARIKLSEKMKTKEAEMKLKMMPVLGGMQKLDPAVAMKLVPMMQKFSAKMEGNKKTDQYFKTDAELKKAAE